MRPDDIKHMVSITPTERLEWLLKSGRWPAAQSALEELIDRSEQFLKQTDAPEDEIIKRLLDGTHDETFQRFDNRFGDLIRDAMETIGGKNLFHRMLVV